jgi:hypothetical protein
LKFEISNLLCAISVSSVSAVVKYRARFSSEFEIRKLIESSRSNGEDTTAEGRSKKLVKARGVRVCCRSPRAALVASAFA